MGGKKRKTGEASEIPAEKNVPDDCEEPTVPVSKKSKKSTVTAVVDEDAHGKGDGKMQLDEPTDGSTKKSKSKKNKTSMIQEEISADGEIEDSKSQKKGSKKLKPTDEKSEIENQQEISDFEGSKKKKKKSKTQAMEDEPSDVEIEDSSSRKKSKKKKKTEELEDLEETSEACDGKDKGKRSDSCSKNEDGSALTSEDTQTKKKRKAEASEENFEKEIEENSDKIGSVSQGDGKRKKKRKNEISKEESPEKEAEENLEESESVSQKDKKKKKSNVASEGNPEIKAEENESVPVSQTDKKKKKTKSSEETSEENLNENGSVSISKKDKKKKPSEPSNGESSKDPEAFQDFKIFSQEKGKPEEKKKRKQEVNLEVESENDKSTQTDFRENWYPANNFRTNRKSEGFNPRTGKRHFERRSFDSNPRGKRLSQGSGQRTFNNYLDEAYSASKKKPVRDEKAKKKGAREKLLELANSGLTHFPGANVKKITGYGKGEVLSAVSWGKKN